MLTAVVEKHDAAPTIVRRATDACRKAAQMSRDALLESNIDVVPDGIRSARRAVRHRVEGLQHLKDEAVHQVKRQPLQAVSAAFGAGLGMGLLAGWLASRRLFRTMSSPK